MAGGSTTRL